MGVRVMVVDDHDLVRHGIKSLLKDQPGIEVIAEASDGEQAIEHCRQLNEQLDVIMMDVNMPVMDGFEATGLIREIEEEHIPIVAMTAFAMQGDRERCMAAGMDDYLAKPFEYEALCEKLSKWLSLSPANNNNIQDEGSYGAA